MAKKYMFLYGKNSVKERLLHKPGSIQKIFLQDGANLQEIEKIAFQYNVPTEIIPAKKIDSIKRPKDHQGVIARVDEFNYAGLDSLLKRKDKPNLVFLDRVTDPHNLGSIMRILACFGRFSLVIPKFKACKVNDTVLHVACGGDNYIQVSLVSNITQSLIKAKKNGYWIVGACVNNKAQDIYGFRFQSPVGVVLGSEGQGIRYGIAKYLDSQVKIPMTGAGLSFNVGMACSIFCYEIIRQREGNISNGEETKI